MSPLVFQSADHSQLLDVIDLLRSNGMGSYVSLPQLIVCGDQSAGKSSVLEAISGVRFPSKESLCTRFPTELILRRNPESHVTIAITPSDERPTEEKEALKRFQAPESQIDDFPVLVEAAKEAMGLHPHDKAYSNDVLRVEVSGPDQPNLTLVDLPGLIHAESKQQSASDVKLVKSMVRGYMEHPRCIILAVVAAKNDYANQIVTKMARDLDSRGMRTIGVITKPDTLHVGSENEQAFLRLAQNEEVPFRLGWHVLKNRDFDTKDWTTEERDQHEAEFFQNGVWKALPTTSMGIQTLRPRLSLVLKQQIVRELPGLIADVEDGISDCRKRLERLGSARGTIHEQRLYLIRISQLFSSLMQAAADGTYTDDFFGPATTDVGFKKRLRAVVQDTFLQFAEEMRENGHYRKINPGNSISEGIPPSRQISQSKYLEKVRDLMRRTRGRELPGTFNPLIIGDLFFEQSQPWAQLLETYYERLLTSVRTTIELALTYSADAVTFEALMRHVINPAFEKCKKSLREKLAEVIQPHQRGHPITYNHYFTATIQAAKNRHLIEQQRPKAYAFFKCTPESGSYINPGNGFDVDHLLDAINSSSEDDMELFACSEATFCMKAYYKVAMKTFVDNFAVLGTEFSLLGQMTVLLTPDVVMGLEDNLIKDIAAETEESSNERARITEKQKVLTRGLEILSRFQRQYNGGSYAPISAAVTISSNGPDCLAVDNEDSDAEASGGDEVVSTSNGYEEGSSAVSEVELPPVLEQEDEPAVERTEPAEPLESTVKVKANRSGSDDWWFTGATKPNVKRKV